MCCPTVLSSVVFHLKLYMLSHSTAQCGVSPTTLCVVPQYCTVWCFTESFTCCPTVLYSVVFHQQLMCCPTVLSSVVFHLKLYMLSHSTVQCGVSPTTYVLSHSTVQCGVSLKALHVVPQYCTVWCFTESFTCCPTVLYNVVFHWKLYMLSHSMVQCKVSLKVLHVLQCSTLIKALQVVPQ